MKRTDAVSTTLGVVALFLVACGSGAGGADGAPKGEQVEPAGVEEGKREADAGTTTLDPPVAPSVDYALEVQPVWDRYCIRCHDRRDPILTAPSSAQALTGGTSNWASCGLLLIPGRPDESYLYFKLTGTSALDFAARRDCQRPMPANWNGNDTPLVEIDPAAVAAVRRWIESLAPTSSGQ